MNAKGLSLVEVVIALAIIAVFLTGITYVFAVGLNAVDRDKIKFSAHNLAKDMLEEVLSKKRLEGSTFGPEAGESRSGATAETVYDDVDDYNGYGETPPKTIDGFVMDGTTPAGGASPLPDYRDFRREVKVEYLEYLDNNLLVSAVPTNYKRITVTVLHKVQRNYTNPNFSNPDFTYNLMQIVTITKSDSA